MATINATVATLLDHAKRLDPDGKVAKIAEMLSQSNEMLLDCLYKEGNLPTGHRSTLRTALPGVGFRRLNAGTTPTKSRTGQTEDATAILEAWGQTDVKVAALNGNTADFRASENVAFIEAMGQEMQGTMLYGNGGTDPEEFDGFSTRYAATSAANGQNIILGGGAGSDNSSMWLVCWGENVHGIYPKGSQAGISHVDHGTVVVQNAGGVTGALMSAYMDQWTWEGGLHIRDWRYAVRIPNIDISALVAESSDADLVKLLIKAWHRIPSWAGVRAAIYTNRTVAEYLDIQRREAVQTGGQLSYKEVDGQMVNAFRGIPIRTCDQLLETEALVS